MSMKTLNSWYSAKPDIVVYHNNDECTEGNNIEPKNVREGTGEKKLCSHCARLNKSGSQFISFLPPLLGNPFLPRQGR